MAVVIVGNIGMTEFLLGNRPVVAVGDSQSRPDWLCGRRGKDQYCVSLSPRDRAYAEGLKLAGLLVLPFFVGVALKDRLSPKKGRE